MAYGFWVLPAAFRRSLDAKHRGYLSLIALYYGKIKIRYFNSLYFNSFSNKAKSACIEVTLLAKPNKIFANFYKEQVQAKWCNNSEETEEVFWYWCRDLKLQIPMPIKSSPRKRHWSAQRVTCNQWWLRRRSWPLKSLLLVTCLCHCSLSLRFEGRGMEMALVCCWQTGEDS